MNKLSTSELLKYKTSHLHQGSPYINLDVQLILRHPDGRVGNTYYRFPFFYKDSDDEWNPTHAVLYEFFECNMSCDCNLMRFFEPDWRSTRYPCGDTISILRISIESITVFDIQGT